MRKYRIPILVLCALIVTAVTLLYTNYKHASLGGALPRAALPSPQVSQGIQSLITEPDQGTTPVLALIQNATKSIDLVMYEMTDKDICDALIDAHRRGVDVRVLLNKGYYGKQEDDINLLAFEYLSRSGVSVEWTPTYFALTHQKTLIIDNARALIMTWNFVPSYYPTGRDFGILDASPADVAAIENVFASDWKSEQAPASYGDDLVWSPQSQSDMALIIQSAHQTLDIYNEEMNDGDVITLLADAVKRGVAVRVIMTYATAAKPAFTELKNDGIALHLFHGKKGLYIHAKMILADEREAFVGSENFSFTSLNKNRELGIFISEPAILESLSGTFQKDWQLGKVF